MLTIDEAIIQAAREGRLKGLTLWRTHDGWQANISVDGVSWSIRMDVDPIAALRAVLVGDEESETSGVFD